MSLLDSIHYLAQTLFFTYRFFAAPHIELSRMPLFLAVQRFTSGGLSTASHLSSGQKRQLYFETARHHFLRIQKAIDRDHFCVFEVHQARLSDSENFLICPQAVIDFLSVSLQLNLGFAARKFPYI